MNRVAPCGPAAPPIIAIPSSKGSSSSIRVLRAPREQYVAPPRPFADPWSLFVFIDTGEQGLKKVALTLRPEEHLERFFETPSFHYGQAYALGELFLQYQPKTIGLSIDGSRGVTRSLTRAGHAYLIVPGRTTVRELRRWLYDRVGALGLGMWFQPDVRVQRQGLLPTGLAMRLPTVARDDTVLQRGDLVHLDFGISYMGLHSDWQR